MKRTMKHTVEIEIEVEAESPEEAAQIAEDAIESHDSFPTIKSVFVHNSNVHYMRCA